MTDCPAPDFEECKTMFWFCNLYTSPMLLMFFHGGRDTIAVALLYWAIIFGVPLFLVVRAIVRRARRRT